MRLKDSHHTAATGNTMKTASVWLASAFFSLSVTATPLPSLALSAMAQESPAAETDSSLLEIQPAQVPLTGALIEQFLNSYPELVRLSETLSAIKTPASGNDDANETEEDPIYALGNYLNDPEAAAQINTALQKYNFSSFSEWANVAHSVALAAEASDMDSGLEDIEGQKKEAIQALQADDTLSEEEKKSALVELEQQFAALAEFVPLPGNTLAVRPYLDRIRALGNTVE